MRLVDTSAWIEWLIGSPVGAAVARELPERSQWLVATIVQLELAKWLQREVGEDKADQVIAFTETCIVADLDTAIALSAADLCLAHLIHRGLGIDLRERRPQFPDAAFRRYAGTDCLGAGG
jgi:predicted nucleic acid-binding protein